MVCMNYAVSVTLCVCVCVRVLCAHRVVPGFPTSDKVAPFSPHSPLQHLGWWIATLATQNETSGMKETEKKTRQVGNVKRKKTRVKEGEQMRIAGGKRAFFRWVPHDRCFFPITIIITTATLLLW